MTRGMTWAMGVGLLAAVAGGCNQEARDLRERGITEFQVGRVEDAQALLNEALEHDAGDAEALYYLGRILHREGLYEQAVFYYQSCLQVRPGHPVARRWLAMAMAELGPGAETLYFLPGQSPPAAQPPGPAP